MRRPTTAVAIACLLPLATPAQAQIAIGAILGITGLQATQGAGDKNAFDLIPTGIAGQKVTCLVRDHGRDSTTAANTWPAPTASTP